MDTEEDAPRPNELQDGTMAEVNALRDLLSQIGDPDAAHASGVIDDDEYAERKARKLAYTAALAAYDTGETPDVSALLDQMREQASQPTQTECGTQEHRGLEGLPDDGLERHALLLGGERRSAHRGLLGQLHALRHVPDSELVAAKNPAVDLAEGLVCLLSGPGEVEPVHPILNLLECDRLNLAVAPLRHQVTADGAAVALQCGRPQALVLVGHVLGYGGGKQHFWQSNL